MANTKEIRGQIESIKSTQKITKAMEMVAASKVRRVQDQMHRGRPYLMNLLRVIAHLRHAISGDAHPFLLRKKEVRKVGYIVVSTDRGLCGGLNINLFKTLMNHIREQQAQGHEIVASVFGRKGSAFLSRVNVPLLSVVEGYPEEPQVHELVSAITPMIDAFLKDEVQAVYIISNQFINAMTQDPKMSLLLPAAIDENDGFLKDHGWDYLYDPSAAAILDKLLRRYLESVVHQAVLENIASEMSARMLAMKNSTDNAGNLINELQLKFNKARQAAITQELTEIIGGADAV